MIKNGFVMRVYIQKADLDTCLAALILDVGDGDHVVVLQHEASEEILVDRNAICIEAGGSGQVHLNNYDHHDPNRYYPPACRQAFEACYREEPDLERLVDYVAMVDERDTTMPYVPFPSLSNLFSGMLLVTRDPIRQFIEGVRMLRTVLTLKLDPFAPVPELQEWQEYLAAKRENAARLDALISSARMFTARSGLRVGYLTAPEASDAIGGIGALYNMGCEVAVLYSPSFGYPPVRKFTIAGNGVRVAGLLDCLVGKEEGWGGRETIIGSPRVGSTLPEHDVLEMVLDGL